MDVARGWTNRYRAQGRILRADDSKLLKAKLESLGYRDHKDYIQSDHWQRIRREHARSLLPQGCVACGSSRSQLHHRSYRRLGRELLLDLVPLCNRHHTEVHRLRRYALSSLHLALAHVLGISAWRGLALLKPYNLDGTAFVPHSRRSLNLMLKRLGAVAYSIQHERITGQYPLFPPLALTGTEARSLCRSLRGS